MKNPYVEFAAIILIVTPLFLVTTVFAGGTHHEKAYQYQAPTPMYVAPNVLVPAQPTPTPQPSSISPAPVANELPKDYRTATEVPKGGGGQVPCSGPTSYGWRVDLPNGGCPTSTVQAPQTYQKPVSFISLSQIPYTGAGDGDGLTAIQLTVWFLFFALLALMVSMMFRTSSTITLLRYSVILLGLIACAVLLVGLLG